MFAMTRGPSMKPAWAATNSSAASASSASATKPAPSGRPPGRHPPAKRSSSEAFIVFPASGVTWNSR